MAGLFNLKVYEADSTFLEGKAEMVVVPTVDGEFGVMARHENMVVSIVPGIMKYRMEGGEMKYAALSSGMMRVEDNDVLVLVESAEHPEEIDMKRALAEQEEAKEAMLQKKSEQDYFLAEAMLLRAVNRIRVKNRAGL